MQITLRAIKQKYIIFLAELSGLKEHDEFLKSLVIYDTFSKLFEQEIILCLDDI